MGTAGLLRTGLLLLVAAACARGTSDTEENVRQALEQANLEAVDVQLDQDAKVLYLSGTVETLAERTRAEEVAAAAVGTSGRVLNDLTVERLDQAGGDDPDAEITASIDEALDSDPVFKTRDVTVDVENGVAVLTGEVRTTNEQFRAAEIIRAIPGVKGVTNTLEVSR